MANIFHELAEKAFKGYFDASTSNVLCSSFPFSYKGGKQFQLLMGFIPESWDFYTDLNPAEQALALLFIGEMYESQN